MRLMDIMLALPSLLLAVAVVAILGPGLINAMYRDRDRDAAALRAPDPRRGDRRAGEGLRRRVAHRRRRHRCG